jgi:HTH-type transcriptional regulator/antitoxin HipB
MIINYPSAIATFLKDWRKKQGLTQSQVGDLAGLKQSTISAIENNPKLTKLDTMFRVLSALGLQLEIVKKVAEKPSLDDEW